MRTLDLSDNELNYLDMGLYLNLGFSPFFSFSSFSYFFFFFDKSFFFSHSFSLPPTQNKIEGLRDLNLSGNHFTELGEELECCPLLEKLELHHNRLESVPSAIYNMMEVRKRERGGRVWEFVC